MKNRKLRLKRKVIPFPALFLLLPAYIEFLYGDDGAFFGMLFMFSLFLVLWYFLGSDLDAPSSPGVRHGRLVDPAFLPPLDAGAAMQDVQLRLWSKRLYEDRSFRGRLFAFALAGLLGATVLFALFSGRVLLRRANILIALCALGLLALAVSALIRRLRRREERDRAAYPSPQVNMTYDYDAAADGRVRALQQRLERLEDWKKSGLIGEEEYEQLRKKYLKR